MVVVLGLDVYLDLNRRMSATRCWAGCTQTQSAWCQGTLGTGEESSLCHTSDFAANIRIITAKITNSPLREAFIKRKVTNVTLRSPSYFNNKIVRFYR